MFFLSVDAIKRLLSELDVFEIFWLLLAAVKVSLWKYNSKPSADDASSYTDSAGSSSACCSVFFWVSPLSNPDSMDSVAREPLHFSLQI